MDIDEIVETIMEIVAHETQWKRELRHRLEADNYHSRIEPDILNIEGLLRERLKGVFIEDILQKNLADKPDEVQWADDLQHAINGIIFTDLNQLCRDEIQEGFNETHTALTIILERLKILSKEVDR